MVRRRRKSRKARKGEDSSPGPEAVSELSGVARLLVESPADTLDLHGSTAAQAERRLFDFLRTRSVDAPGRVVHVITGRGNRSEGAPVLPGLVRDLLRAEMAEFVRESAGLPGGGGVAIRIR
jgi:DNA-nicking Smr family endonuclease